MRYLGLTGAEDAWCACHEVMNSVWGEPTVIPKTSSQVSVMPVLKGQGLCTLSFSRSQAHTEPWLINLHVGPAASLQGLSLQCVEGISMHIELCSHALSPLPRRRGACPFKP